VLASLALGCALPSCGGTEQLSAGERALRADVTEALTSKDPDSCNDFATQRFLEQLTREHGRAALDRCRADADETDVKSIAFERVAISGARASATVRPEGAEKDGLRRLELKLRKGQHHWRIDRLSGATLDRGEFERAVREELTAPPNALDRASAGCVLRELRSVSDARLARSIISGDSSPALRAIRRCLSKPPPAELDGTV
jgi:hypothetical protein